MASMIKMEREDGGPDAYRCDNCERTWTFEELDNISDFSERVSPGCEVPAGECPDPDETCGGSLCYPVEIETTKAAAPAPSAQLANVAGALTAIREYLDGACEHAQLTPAPDDCYVCGARQSAERALVTVQQLQAEEQTQASWCKRLIDAYGTLVEYDVFFDPKGTEEHEQLDGATEPLETLVEEARQYLARTDAGA